MHKMNTMVTAQLSEIQTLTHIISLYLCHSVTKSRSPKFWQSFLKLGIIRPKARRQRARHKCTKSYNWLIMCISILQYYDLTDFWQLHSRLVRCAQCSYKKTCSRPKPNYVSRALINRNGVVIWKEMEGMHWTPATSAATIDIVS